MELLKFYSILIGTIATILGSVFMALKFMARSKVEIALGTEEKRITIESCKKPMDDLRKDFKEVETRLENRWKELEERDRRSKAENLDSKDLLKEWAEGIKDTQDFLEKMEKLKRNAGN